MIYFLILIKKILLNMLSLGTEKLAGEDATCILLIL